MYHVRLAVGTGTNKVVTSTDGITWTAQGNPFSTATGMSVIWAGNIWIAGTTSGIYTSTNGTSWTNRNSFPTNGLAWDGSSIVAVGSDATGQIIRSTNFGSNWSYASSGGTIFTTAYGVCWNGKMFVAVGTGTNTYAISANGITWTGMGISLLSTGYGVASNPGIGIPVVDSQLVLNQSNNLYGNRLDVISDAYYDANYTNFSMKVTSR